jgi:hypothetical protein
VRARSRARKSPNAKTTTPNQSVPHTPLAVGCSPATRNPCGHNQDAKIARLFSVRPSYGTWSTPLCCSLYLRRHATTPTPLCAKLRLVSAIRRLPDISHLTDRRQVNGVPELENGASPLVREARQTQSTVTRGAYSRTTVPTYHPRGSQGSQGAHCTRSELFSATQQQQQLPRHHEPKNRRTHPRRTYTHKHLCSVGGHVRDQTSHALSPPMTGDRVDECEASELYM